MAYKVNLREVQTSLKERYRPDAASPQVVTDARSVPSDPQDPRHCAVAPSETP